MELNFRQTLILGELKLEVEESGVKARQSIQSRSDRKRKEYSLYSFIDKYSTNCKDYAMISKNSNSKFISLFPSLSLEND